MDKCNIDTQSVLVFVPKNPVSIRLNNVHDMKEVTWNHIYTFSHFFIFRVYLKLPILVH